MWLRAVQPPPSAGGIAVARLPLLGHYVVLWTGKDFQTGSNLLGSESSLPEGFRKGGGVMPFTEVPGRQMRSAACRTRVFNLAVKPVNHDAPRHDKVGTGC